MESIKEYAKRSNISYEAVRKQVKRYSKELDGHIQKVGRTQFLDADAILFLDSKRQSNPIVIQQMDKDDTIERLENENKALLIKIAELQDELLKEKDQIKILQNEKIELLEMKNHKQQGFISRIFGKR